MQLADEGTYMIRPSVDACSKVTNRHLEIISWFLLYFVTSSFTLISDHLLFSCEYYGSCDIMAHWLASTKPQPSAAGVAVDPTPGCCFARYIGIQWGSGSPINWLYWLTRCGPQPLQNISASWYRPMHHLKFCTLPMLRCWSFLAYTLNWPVAFFLLLLHPPVTLYLLTFDCSKTFSLSNVTWKPIFSNSLSPPVLHQAPLYLQT